MKITYVNVLQILVLAGCITFYSIFMFQYFLSRKFLKPSSASYPLPQFPAVPGMSVNVGKGLIAEVNITPKRRKGVSSQGYVDISMKVDWHNYTFINYEKSRTGRGEQGKPDKLLATETINYRKLWSQNGFNAALSDKLSLDRSVSDIRHPFCASKKYLKHLGKASVIIPIHNEHWSTLLRNVHSIINRSPAVLLKEIILVDDKSTKAFLRQPLDDYMRKYSSKVKVIHMTERGGLIKARLVGIEAAQGDVIIILDSHCEVNVNWLPPLLEPIAKNYKTCMCPFVDVIDNQSFEYRAQDNGARGAFDWEFHYKRLPLLPEDLVHPIEPFKSPVMAGGLFAMSRQFFWELGGYDEGLQIWGGEQYELSFKIWMCGGQMLDAPCSRVGHVYRHDAPAFPNNAKGDFLAKNYRRVAEVWMDEFAKYLYMRNPHWKNVDPGDLTELKARRKQLNCTSFKWFMKNVAFDMVDKYPPIQPGDFANGKLSPKHNPNLCIDVPTVDENSVLNLVNCSNAIQNFQFTYLDEIRVKGYEMCFDLGALDRGIILYKCHTGGGNQLFHYNTTSGTIRAGEGNNCLVSDDSNLKVSVSDCKPNTATQEWKFEHVYPDEIKDWARRKALHSYYK